MKVSVIQGPCWTLLFCHLTVTVKSNTNLRNMYYIITKVSGEIRETSAKYLEKKKTQSILTKNFPGKPKTN